MDYSLSTANPNTLSLQFLPSSVKSCQSPSLFPPPNLPFRFPTSYNTFLNRKLNQLGVPVIVVARAGSSQCEPSSSSLNTPLELRSGAGKFLSGVFQNQRQLFHVAVADELKLLSDDRDGAVSRMFLSSGSDEASLHRFVPRHPFYY